MKARERLRAVAARILRDGDGCQELHDLLAEVAGAPEGTTDVALPSGLALAPTLAAQCILDPMRTVGFLRGTRAALQETRRRFPDGPIEVVYAGTGPFAPLALPLMVLGETPAARFTLIDIHRESVESVARLVDRFGLHAAVRDIVHADAATYEHPAAIQVVITETLQRSLKAEPFVAIVHNLRRQLAPGGLLVPECVFVSVAAVEARADPITSPREDRTTVFAIGVEGESAEPVIVNLQPGWVALFTEIQVFDGIVLGDYDSGLTVPEIVWELSGARSGEVEFQYVPDGNPGVRFNRG